MQAKRWLSTEIFLLGIGEIFQLEPSAMCLQNKLSSPFVFVILYYSDYRWFTTMAKHGTYDRSKYNGTRPTNVGRRQQWREIAVSTWPL